jgi:hypothetical protein
MLTMVCRNRVEDFATWYRAFQAHEAAHKAAGLTLLHIGHSIDNGNQVFFVFEVASLDKARSFIGSPDADETGRAAGVIEGEYHFVESRPGYG